MYQVTGYYCMSRIAHITMQADSTGTLELVCERTSAEKEEPTVRSFVGKDEFGLLVDDLEPNEHVTLFFEAD